MVSMSYKYLENKLKVKSMMSRSLEALGFNILIMNGKKLPRLQYHKLIVVFQSYDFCCDMIYINYKIFSSKITFIGYKL